MIKPTIGILCFLMSTSVMAQINILPRTGEGRMNRSEATAFLPNQQFLVPGFRWSNESIQVDDKQKWWRLGPTLPQPENLGLKGIRTNKGDLIWVEPLLEGTISLYREAIKEATTSALDSETSFKYWIESYEIKEINRLQYKSILKEYLPEAKTLHQNFGKPGFKFENIPSMLIYYNQFFGDNQIQINPFLNKPLLL